MPKYENFVFYGNWLNASIMSMPIEQQDKIIADIVRYGVGAEMAHQDEIGPSMAVSFVMDDIERAKAKYAQKSAMGTKTQGEKVAAKEAAIEEALQNGCKTAQEVANYTGYGKSTVEHSESWKNRMKI